MAQTKRKRRSKHRGNAVGTIEARGRTGRKLSDDERKAAAALGRPGTKGTANGAPRPHRLDTPPTWRASLIRAGIAGLVFFAVALLLLKKPAADAAVLALFAVAIYIPMGYYTDLFVHRRRMGQKPRAPRAPR